MSNTVTSTQYIHSCYAKSPKNAEPEDWFSAVVVKEKVVVLDTDINEVVSTESRFKIINNPPRRVWITKPEYRNHRFKKETEIAKHCDMYVLEDSALPMELFKILNDAAKYDERIKLDKVNPRYPKLRDLCSVPYVYGADIDMEALIRTKYEKAQKHDIVPLTTGALDIEASVLGQHGLEEINACTIICGKHIYTAALDSFLGNNVDATGKKFTATARSIYDRAHVLLKPYFDKYKDLTLTVKTFVYESDLLRWLFNNMHEENVDYMCIWNMGFDVPYIMKRCKILNMDPRELFCSPEIPRKYWYCNFKEDKKKVAHVVEKWHWFSATSGTQFVDSMTLFARVRKAQPKRSKYSLDAISKEELKDGKLEFNEAGHYEMQTEHFEDYVVYNIKDALLVQLMEWKNHDTNTLYGQTAGSNQSEFNKQSVMLKNGYQQYCLEHGAVFASVGTDMEGPYDSEFSKVGGAVLNATDTRNIGVNCIVERPSIETQVLPFVGDFDYEALYPKTKISTGISIESKYSTCVSIEGLESTDIEPLFSGIVNPKENAVWIGHKYFGLPNFEEMEELVLKSI